MGVLNEFLAGVQKGRNETVALPEIPHDIGTVDDFREYRPDDFQDPSQPGADPVRTVDGILDFMSDVVEDLTEWVEREAGAGHADKPRKRSNPVLRTLEIGASEWAPRRYNVTFGTQIASRRETRRTIRLVNWGTEWVFISQSAIPAWDVSGSVPPNVAIVPPSDLAQGRYFPIDLPITDQLWARVAPNAAGSILEVIEMFGLPE